MYHCMATGIEGTFTALAVLLVSAVIVVGVARMLKQPLMIGYIGTGLVLSVALPAIIGSTAAIETFASIGVIFLLFMVGLNLDPDMVKNIGKVSMIAGFTQVAVTGVAAFFFVRFLEFSLIASFYLGFAATFSSTIIIMKLLSDMDELDALHGRILTGMLIVQDLIVISAMLLISSVLGENGSFSIFTTSLIGGGLLFLVALATLYVFPRITKKIADEQEFLLLFSVAWCFALASLFHQFNFTMEAGALLAGIALSTSPYRLEIAAKMKPLRDFFLMIFFVLLGLQLSPSTITAQIVPATLISAFILVVKPVIVMAVLGMMRYHRRTSFLVGSASAQISEFSLILIGVGISLGHINEGLQSLMTLVGLITITVSSYLILYSDQLYPYVSRFLHVFERDGSEDEEPERERYDAFLFGHNRIGHSLAEALRETGKEFLVIDHDPEVIDALEDEPVDCRYGDAADIELLESLRLAEAELVISTIPVKDVNLLLVKRVRERNPDAVIILVSHRVEDALELYEAGASYVVLPHFLGGDHAALMVREYGADLNQFLEEQAEHIEELQRRKELGHEHPRHEDME